MSEKRLLMLEKLTSGGSADPFAWYALALEYGNQGRVDDAVGTFTRLRALDPAYVPQYLMCGMALVRAGRPAEAKPWFEAGLEVAKAKGDKHAVEELGQALDDLDD